MDSYTQRSINHVDMSFSSRIAMISSRIAITTSISMRMHLIYTLTLGKSLFAQHKEDHSKILTLRFRV